MANSFDIEMETPELETLSSLAQHLVYRLPECGDTTIRLTLREAYRDFCRRSCCLRVRRRFCGQHFHIPVVFGGSVLKVTEVSCGSRRLRPSYDYNCVGCDISVPRFRNEEVTVSWVEVPPLSCEEAPKWVIEKYGDALCSGVLARLCSQINRPWGDPQMAVVESQRYEAAVNEVCQSLYENSSCGALGTVFDTSDMI